MRHNPAYASEDPEVVRRLIEENPWAVLVSQNADSDEGDGLVASHCPILLDPEAEGLTILTHLGKPDDELHGLGEGEMLVIVQGEHGYVSPSWYAPGATRAPTWNFSVAHLYGTPEILSEEENLESLTRLVERFERHVEEPMYLDREWAAPFARGTVGIRLRVERFTCKRKLSQDKDPVSRRNVIERLREPGPYQHPALADEVEREVS
ncbi:MAG: FMN-binding negative transcriptional regulator [Solirubrobacterales bacterium]